jgi:hypothetical protein
MESFSRRVPRLAIGLFILGLMGCGPQARIDVQILEARDRSRDFERAVISLSAIELLREDEPAPVSLGETRLLELVAPSSVGIERPPLSPGHSRMVSAKIPAVPYRAIRLVISGGFLEVVQADGSTKIYATEGYDVISSNVPVAGVLTLAEEASSGFEVLLSGEPALATQLFAIFLDFEVRSSFRQDGTVADRWVMHPHVTATMGFSSP